MSFGAGNFDVWLIKTDANGDTNWTKTFGGSNYDNGKSVQQTKDGGYIITGTTMSFGAGNHDVWLIKTNANGESLWEKTYGGISGDDAFSVKQTSDSGYIIVGDTRSFGSGGEDAWLIKTDESGDTIWTKTFGGSSSNERGKSVQQTSDGGYIITGSTYNFGGGYGDVLLIKANANGDTVWTKTIGGEYSDGGNSVQQTNDGGYIITGHTVGQSGLFPDGYEWLIKTDALGDTHWTRTFKEKGWGHGNCVQQTTDGGYIATGWCGARDVLIIKHNVSGDILWTKNFGDSLSFDEGNSVQQTTDNGYIIVATTDNLSYNSDVWLIRVARDITSIDENPHGLASNYQLHQNYPNPFNPSTKITFTLPKPEHVTLAVYNTLGQKVATLLNTRMTAGSHDVTFDASTLPSGIYFYRIQAGEFSQVRKMVLLR
jgi:hypothetical protein